MCVGERLCSGVGCFWVYYSSQPFPADSHFPHPKAPRSHMHTHSLTHIHTHTHIPIRTFPFSLARGHTPPCLLPCVLSLNLMSSYVTLFPCHVSSSQTTCCSYRNCTPASLGHGSLWLHLIQFIVVHNKKVFLLPIFLAHLDNSVCFWIQERIFWNGKHSLLVGCFFPDAHKHTHLLFVDSRVFPVGCSPVHTCRHVGTQVWVSRLLDFDSFLQNVFWSKLSSSYKNKNSSASTLRHQSKQASVRGTTTIQNTQHIFISYFFAPFFFLLGMISHCTLQKSVQQLAKCCDIMFDFL